MKITRYKLLGIIILMLLCLTGCGKRKEIEGSISQIAPIDKEVELDINQLGESLRPSIVQIIQENHVGSGVIYDVNQKEILILSCRHLLDKSNLCEITFGNGITYQGKIIWLSKHHDLAMVEVEKSLFTENQLLQLSKVEVGAYKPEQMQKGQELFLYASVTAPASHGMPTYLMESEVEVTTRELYAKQSMMAGFGTIEYGMSGGGVFDLYGRLVGILSGSNIGEQEGEPFWVAVPVWEFDLMAE